MAIHTASVGWVREGANFVDGRYSRGHLWRFDGGVEVPASASPHVVPLPMSVEAAVDPEEAFVAALASCHMLFFLSFAAQRGIVVESYDDEAEGLLAPDATGSLAITRVTLRPRVVFQTAVSVEVADELHHRAHEACFLARSVRFPVLVEARPPSVLAAGVA